MNPHVEYYHGYLIRSSRRRYDEVFVVPVDAAGKLRYFASPAEARSYIDSQQVTPTRVDATGHPAEPA